MFKLYMSSKGRRTKGTLVNSSKKLAASIEFGHVPFSSIPAGVIL